MVLTVSRCSPRVTPRWSRRVSRPGKRNISLTNSLTGSAALVTGGTSGIGRATALALAQRGAHVVLFGVTQGAAKRWWRRSARRAGPLASSRPNSGVGTSTSWSTTQRFPLRPGPRGHRGRLDTVFNLNVKAPFFLVADPVPKMAKRRHGVIVNVSTMVAEFGIPRIAPYVSSKAALALLTKAWRPSTGPPGSGSTPSALAAPGWADPQRSVPLPEWRNVAPADREPYRPPNLGRLAGQFTATWPWPAVRRTGSLSSSRCMTWRWPARRWATWPARPHT